MTPVKALLPIGPCSNKLIRRVVEAEHAAGEILNHQSSEHISWPRRIETVQAERCSVCVEIRNEIQKARVLDIRELIARLAIGPPVWSTVERTPAGSPAGAPIPTSGPTPPKLSLMIVAACVTVAATQRARTRQRRELLLSMSTSLVPTPLQPKCDARTSL